MQVGIVGLGLIGGSLAKAYKRSPGIKVLGVDIDHSIVEFAKIAEAIDGELTDADLGNCDCIILAAYPQGVIDWVRANAPLFSAKTTVIDCSGTKKRICDVLFPVAKEYGFTFIGGHPMAGTHQSGFKYSREDLFDGAPMVIVPPSFEDIRLLDHVKTLLAPLGFGHISATTADDHDEVIAFTSQMTHIISNAFIKSPTASRHKGYSAGSYRDLTRVAWLMPDMWTELFLENKEFLLEEIDVFLAAMQQYKTAIQTEDSVKLRALLDEGRLRKREVDGP
ncbi:MAG: prephenate dehydrogenase/arogenate dehydrogenase family protein [Defluviitaleaceae bacterium]|nr:prephenate dehydrogenase/arogenate dehydrogenase family protein [Defluviitaleaceae bacterium]